MGVHRAWGPSPGTVLSIDAWAQDALALLAALPGVRRVGLALVEGGGRRLRFTASDRDETPTIEWCDVDGYDDVPLNVALRTRRIVSGTVAELSVRFEEFVAQQGGTATVALAAVPMESADRPVGGYVLFYDRPQTFDVRQHRALTRLGQDLGAALRRAQRGEARAADDSAEATADGTGFAAHHRVTAEPAAVSGARRFLRGNLHDWEVDDETADTAVLCLSELVTNAVIHSHAGCAVRVRLDEGLLTTTVRDSGTADATTLAALDDPLQVHGRGLMVVEALASRWGYELDTGAPRSGSSSRSEPAPTSGSPSAESTPAARPRRGSGRSRRGAPGTTARPGPEPAGAAARPAVGRASAGAWPRGRPCRPPRRRPALRRPAHRR